MTMPIHRYDGSYGFGRQYGEYQSAVPGQSLGLPCEHSHFHEGDFGYLTGLNNSLPRLDGLGPLSPINLPPFDPFGK